MPSWNIHTAHVERLLAERQPQELGIADANAFLFGNYVPDIYLGFMVPDTTFKIDYCLTHLAEVNMIPVPNADKFWNDYICRRRSKSPTGVSLVLGAWAHLATDQLYNCRFRALRQTRTMPEGDELRTSKQADFDLFGRSLGASNRVQITDELLEAAMAFRPYSVLPDDVARTVDVADRIVREAAELPDDGMYRLLDADWLTETFNECSERLAAWMSSWQKLEANEVKPTADNVREEAGLPALRAE